MKTLLFNTITFLFVSLGAFAQNQKDNRNLENALAIIGYDPVAYFTQGKAIEGKNEFAVNIDGAIYYTASKKNAALLSNNPEKYEPQYGGWCAYAMGDSGEKVSIYPESFKIVDGKLYLFYHTIFSNTLKKWNQNQETLKNQADRKWKAYTQ